MASRQRILAVASVAVALVCALPARALANHTQESILMDDNHLIYDTPAHVEQTLQMLASLGVDRVKVSVVWGIIAPDTNSSHKPNFDATNPAAYPAGAWSRYDLIVRVAKALGLKVYFQLTPGVPQWATYLPQQGDSLGRAPRPSYFKDFVEAVGKRYSGGYVDPSGGAFEGLKLPISVPGIGTPTSSPLPRVSFWGVWNEPNYRSWLNPWYKRLSGGKTEYLQPSLYRGLVDAAWSALGATGHGGDTILIGELANSGLAPATFLEALYCVNGHNHRLSGNSAREYGCPTKPRDGDFLKNHPGLFHATGLAHHPYQYNIPPDRPYPVKTWFTIYNLGALERLENGILGSFGVHRSVPIYNTEWGYKTNPPNPYSQTTWTDQAEWLDEGDYMSWRDSYVRSVTQFLLYDSAPDYSQPAGSRHYWGTFQTGLIELNNKRKPAFYDYRVPIWLPSQHHGHRVTVWGQLRVAPNNTVQYAALEFKRKGTKKWKTLTELQTNNSEGYLLNHVSIPSAGAVKLAWLDSSNNKTYYSRTVSVS